MPSTAHNQIESLFLRLPAELRNIIYGFALDTAEFVAENPFDMLLRRSNLYLTQVCRQIRSETRPFLKKFSTARLSCTWSSHARFGFVRLLMSSIHRHRLGAVRKLDMSLVVAESIWDDILMASFYSTEAERDGYEDVLSQIFPSLDEIGLPMEAKHVEWCDIRNFRGWFKKPQLRISYTNIGFWRSARD